MLEAKPRNAQSTREAILLAARIEFSRRAFSEVGLREIAKRAGVNIALPNRYFGSKGALFEAAVLPNLHLDALLGGSLSGLEARLFTHFSSSTDGSPQKDALSAVALSQSDASVQDAIRHTLEWRVVAPMTRWLGGTRARERAMLILSLLLGHSQMASLPGVGGDKAAQDMLVSETVRQIMHLTAQGSSRF